MVNQDTDQQVRTYGKEHYPSMVDLQQFESNLVTACHYGQGVFLDCESADLEEFPTQYAGLFSAVKNTEDQEACFSNVAFLIRIDLVSKSISLMQSLIPYGVMERLSEEEKMDMEFKVLYEEDYESLLMSDLAHELSRHIGEVIAPRKKPLYSASLSMKTTVNGQAAPAPNTASGPPAPKPLAMGPALPMSELAQGVPSNHIHTNAFAVEGSHPNEFHPILRILNIQDAENAVVLCLPTFNLVYVAPQGFDVNDIKERQLVAVNYRREIMYIFDQQVVN